MQSLLIGWAEESLVPSKKISLAGQFYERISDEVESPITATAMAVECGGERIILVSADIGEIQPFLMKMIRNKFAARNREVAPESLIVAATHTHTSHTFGNPEGDRAGGIAAVKIIEEYVGDAGSYQSTASADETVMTPVESSELVSERIAIAADRAWHARKKAYYTNEFGRAPVGMCRRATYDDGTAQMWGDTNSANFVSLEGGNDSGIELLYFFDEAHELTGIAANIACPAQILGQRSVISADYWGRARANLRQRLGKNVYLLALCGAAGDQCPRDLVRWVTPETPIADPNVKRPHPLRRKADPSMYDISGCNKVGKRVSNEILSVLEEITAHKEEALLVHKVLHLDLPLRKVTLTEFAEADAAMRAFSAQARESGSFNFEDIAKMYIHAGAIKRFREQQYRETYTAEIHVIRLGDVAILTCPFELYLDYGNRIKARSYAEQTFIVELCCGRGGYLPTEKAERAGHYSAYVSSGTVGHAGGDQLVRTAIDRINEMFEE